MSTAFSSTKKKTETFSKPEVNFFQDTKGQNIYIINTSIEVLDGSRFQLNCKNITKGGTYNLNLKNRIVVIDTNEDVIINLPYYDPIHVFGSDYKIYKPIEFISINGNYTLIDKFQNYKTEFCVDSHVKAIKLPNGKWWLNKIN